MFLSGGYFTSTCKGVQLHPKYGIKTTQADNSILGSRVYKTHSVFRCGRI